jgi:hypothetical protein
MCGDVGREAARFLQRRPEEIEQGARQLGDKARGQETPTSRSRSCGRRWRL